MSVIDRVAQRWDAITKEAVAIVPEWLDEQGKPTIVYAEPWTVLDHEKFIKLYGEEADWAAQVVVSKAKGEDGALLFDPKDIVKLRSKGERHVVLRVAQCITFSMSMEDARKKLDETETMETATP